MKLAIDAMIIIILAGFLAGAFFYPQFPDQIPSHWNARGQADGYMPKFWALFMMPIVSIVFMTLFIAIPKLDPLRSNIKKFYPTYKAFIVVFLLFMFYIQTLIISWSLGVTFNMNQALSPAFAALLYFMGVLMARSKRNWFIGIRTPWTLSSTRVWNRTHQRGSQLFKASALIALLGLALPDYAIILILVPIILSAIYLVAYSYFEYRK